MAGQVISPDQWSSIKHTINALNEAEANGETDLTDWFWELRDKLSELVVAATDPVKPFEVSEHFCYLLDMYVAGSTLQSNIGDGSRLVIEWAQQTLESAAAMGINPCQGGTEAIWLVVQAMEGNPE